MISFLVTTKDEGSYIENLLDQIVSVMSDDDEIVIIDDFSHEEETLSILDKYEKLYPEQVTIHYHSLENDFATHKNFGIEQCTKSWIFQLDADELMNEFLLNNIHTLLEYNDDMELFFVPRVNIVHGLTSDDIMNWGWKLTEKNWVMWPDYQGRLFKNLPNIRWVGKVHERIEGHANWTTLPDEEEWALYHEKTIDRQREQNALYETI